MNVNAAEIRQNQGPDPGDLAGKYLTFNLSEEEYGLRILKVREIIGAMEITPIPKIPDYMLGVINLRGRVIPVADLRLRFGLPYKDFDDRTCIILLEVQTQNKSLTIGIVVDQVNEVAEIKQQDVELTPDFGISLDTAFILGMAKVGKGVKTLLDMDQVFTASNLAIAHSM